jgi:hypothetical protein
MFARYQHRFALSTQQPFILQRLTCVFVLTYVRAFPDKPCCPSYIHEIHMEELIRRLNNDYGFGLTEEEIKKIALQAEEINQSFKPLHEIDLSGIAPFQRVDLMVRR